jgi:hypothetical protein
LKDLQASNTSIDDLLSPKKHSEDITKPFSSRVKLAIEYNENEKKYFMSE